MHACAACVMHVCSYKYLGKGTLVWKGDDASRCKAILKEVSEALGLTKDQAQIGRSKLFLKQPQTLFQLEKLRSKKFGAFAKVHVPSAFLQLMFGFTPAPQIIQRAYRSWSERKALINTRLAVAKSFLGKKQRRAQSIFRPFTGQYLSQPLTQKWEGMQQYLQMGRRETVVFSEDCAQVALPADAPPPPPGQQWQWRKVVPILTSDRIILFDDAPPVRPPSFSLPDCPPQTVPVMAVRMIVRLEDITGVTRYGTRVNHGRTTVTCHTGLQLSPGADDALVVSVRPSATVTYASVMEADESSNSCRNCQVEFSFFGKHRHHCRSGAEPPEIAFRFCCLTRCRGCGKLFCHECSPEEIRRFPANRVHQVRALPLLLPLQHARNFSRSRRAAAPSAWRCSLPACPRISASAPTAAQNSSQFCSRCPLPLKKMNPKPQTLNPEP